MSNNNDDSRCESKTTDNGKILFASKTYTTEVHDSLTGKTYSHSGYDEKETQRGAWEKAGKDK